MFFQVLSWFLVFCLTICSVIYAEVTDFEAKAKNETIGRGGKGVKIVGINLKFVFCKKYFRFLFYFNFIFSAVSFSNCQVISV